MESPHQARKITAFLLLFFFFAMLGLAAWGYVSSPILARMAKRADMPLHLVWMTEPAMQISYNPSLRKAVVTISAKKCEREKRNTCFSNTPHRYFVPEQTDQDLFWQNTKTLLAGWRYNPLLMFKPLGAYLRARWQSRTDIGAAEFFTIATELAQMQESDFTLTYPVQKKAKKSRKPVEIEAVSAEKLLSESEAPSNTLRVKIWNASGKKGLAQNLTQYLRRKNQQGIIKVDVVEKDNCARKEKTEIIDYSGRLIQVHQLGHIIGFKDSIKTENTPKDDYDTDIFLGEDFEMPL